MLPIPAGRGLAVASLLIVIPLWATGGAMAHEGIKHPTAATAATQAAAPAATGVPLPFPVEIDARFSLIDQTGRAVTEGDFRGKPMVLFFGYANCESICTVALPLMGAALNALGDSGDAITPVMITVDPEHDTPEYLARAMARYHPRMVGLTGTPAALAKARQAFQVQVVQVAEDPVGEPIYAHGGFIYLIDAGGNVVSVLPPILSPDRMAELMRRHLLQEQAPQG